MKFDEQLQQTVKTNLSEFVEEDNETFRAAYRAYVDEFYKFVELRNVFLYVSVVLGIPGNVLSAIVWLRLHVARKNSSAVYLAALSINDLAFLLFNVTFDVIHVDGWFYFFVDHMYLSATSLEPLLVLGFSVERLLAICWPLQV